MRDATPRAGKPANEPTDTGVGHDRLSRRATDALMAVARAIAPKKTDIFLAEIADVDERTAERWLAGKSNISLAAFIRMLWCAHGDKFQDAVMPDITDRNCPAYWRRRKKIQEMAALRQAHAEQARRLQQYELSFTADD